METYNDTETTINNTYQTQSMWVSWVTLVSTVVLLFIAVAGLAYYIWYGMHHTPASVSELHDDSMVTDELEENEPIPLSSSEKLERLESLETNPQNVSEAAKRARLEQLNVESY